ncbi:MAG: COX15/CtaA family protein [Parvibaculaceae bacterium]
MSEASFAAVSRPLSASRAVIVWLYAMAALVFAMVIVGGATRLTESGLSITEWQPLLGAIPPLDESHWLEAFEKYKAIPQYQFLNSGMSLEEFKIIYWWEWSHRFLGRFIGVAYLLPLVTFWFLSAVPRPLLPRLLAIFALGGAQGALGWFMVMSGLSERVDVSPYRLAAHLTLAALIFAAILWVAFGLNGQGRALGRRAVPALVLVGLVFLQIFAGGLVAGLDAGMGYNTWPLMDGALIPSGLGAMEPWWRNLFENALTAQFDHRVLAYVLLAAAAVNALTCAPSPRRSAVLLLGAILLQATVGVWTLLAQVQIHVALTHQGGAMLVLAAALWHLHRAATGKRSPAVDLSRQPQPIA